MRITRFEHILHAKTIDLKNSLEQLTESDAELKKLIKTELRRRQSIHAQWFHSKLKKVDNNRQK